MNQTEVEAFVAGMENVQREENFGYVFFFVGDDHRLSFVTIANSDSDFDNASNLNREGVFRVNIGIPIEKKPEREYREEPEELDCAKPASQTKISNGRVRHITRDGRYMRGKSLGCGQTR